MRPPRICFYGLFGQGNLGNECTLQAILYHARRHVPDGRFTCICTDPADTSSRHQIAAVPISARYLRKGDAVSAGSGGRLARWVRRALLRISAELRDWITAFRTLWGADMLIVPGTGFLTDASSSPLGWPYDIFKWSLVAKLCSCKLVYASVGAGPIYRPLSRWFITSALAFADSRSYRDSSTMEYLARLGFSKAGDRVYPDLAWSLPPALLEGAAVHNTHRPVVGIGLMNSPGRLSTDRPDAGVHRAYLEKLAIFTKWLLANEYDVKLLIGDVAYDRAATRELIDLVNDDASRRDGRRVVDTPALSVEQLLSQLAATDVVVATRFHNALLALALNKPVISVSFHHKCVSLMAAMGLSEYSQDMRDLDVGRLIERFGELERNANKLKPLLRQRVDEYRNVLDQQYRLIFGDAARRDRALR